MSNSIIAQKIQNTDALISQFETKAIASVETAMDKAFKAMESEFRRKWLSVESLDLAGKDRAILLIQDIKQYLDLLPAGSGNIEKLYQDLVKDCQFAGISFGRDSIESINGFTAATVKPNLKAIAYQAQDAADRLSRHSKDFQLRASAVIEQGLVGGSSMGKVAEMLRRELGVTKSKAETIARTESMGAMDSATRDTYRSNGIQYVQRIGTQDKLICPYCAARVGNVYPVDKAPAILHPRDRCYNAPFSPDWVDLGLVDMNWLQNHRSQSIAALGDKSPDYGPSPFERMAGQFAPEPYWTVDKGFTGPREVPKPAKTKTKATKTKAAKTKAPVSDAFPRSLEGLKEIRKLGGSTGAVLVEDSEGNRFVKKMGASPEHLLEESRADNLYSKMGVLVPDHKIYRDANGDPVKLARFIEGEAFGDLKGDRRTAAISELKKHFAIDALMGNWDVLGLDGDNVLVDKDGKVWRIDNGGSLRYRAMGSPKGGAWNKYPTELWSLRDGGRNNTQAPAAFSGMDWYDVVEQIEAIKLPKFSKDDKELGDMLKLRLAEMYRTAATSKTMKADQWRSGYVDKFTKHGMGYRAAGIVDLLADSMDVKSVLNEGEYLDTPVDAQGRPYDNIRHSDVKTRIDKYYKDNGMDYATVQRYRSDQLTSSWNNNPLALKALIANSRTVPSDSYLWLDKKDLNAADRERASYSSQYQAWEDSMIAAHAWTYEQLSKIDMPNIDRSKGTIDVWRTEGDDYFPGGKPSAPKSFKYSEMKRGAVESTSLFAPIEAVAGSIVTRQSVPLHRVFADYMLKSESASSGFMSDYENEATVILEGIDFEYTAKRAGHRDPSSDEKIDAIQYDPVKGVIQKIEKKKKKKSTTPPPTQLDDNDDEDLDSLFF
jgi:SPP1 gp7 family putative phage head morphogenesis protein